MRSVLPDLQSIRFCEVFDRKRLDDQGDEDGLRLDKSIREKPENAVIALDLRGLLYLGYSYAKPTLRQALLRRNAGEYGERRLFLVADQGERFLDGIEAALREKNLFTLLAEDLEKPLEKARLIGQVPDYIRSMFDLLRRTAPAPTGALAKATKQTPQNTKNRLDRLYEMGLLRREKVTSPSGGLEWLNWVF